MIFQTQKQILNILHNFVPSTQCHNRSGEFFRQPTHSIRCFLVIPATEHSKHHRTYWKRERSWIPFVSLSVNKILEIVVSNRPPPKQWAWNTFYFPSIALIISNNIVIFPLILPAASIFSRQNSTVAAITIENTLNKAE